MDLGLSDLGVWDFGACANMNLGFIDLGLINLRFGGLGLWFMGYLGFWALGFRV